MSLLRTDRSWREEVRHRVPVRYLPQTRPDHLRGTGATPSPRASTPPSPPRSDDPPTAGFVAAASADVPTGRTLLRTVAGREVVLWRDGDGTLLAGPGQGPTSARAWRTATSSTAPCSAAGTGCRWAVTPAPVTG